MSGQTPVKAASTALVATLLVSGVGIGVPTNTARADDCLTAPNAPAPPGSHWYYHMDRANQRKCWYVRATDQPTQNSVAQDTSDPAVAPTVAHKQPATNSASVPLAISPGDSGAQPLPTVKPPRASMRGPITDQLVQESAQKGSTAPIQPATDSASAPKTSAPMSINPGDSVAPPLPTVNPQAFPLSNATTNQALQPAPIERPLSSLANTSPPQAGPPSQTSDEGAGPSPARPSRPEPPMATVNTQASSPIPNHPQTEAVQPTAEIGAADDAARTAQGNVWTSKAGTMASLISTPVAVFPIAALGLVVVGFLLRIVLNLATARRQRIVIDRHDRIDDGHEDELRDDQFVRQPHGLSESLKLSNIPIENRIGDESPNNARGRMPGAPLGNKVNTPEHRRIDFNARGSDWIGNQFRPGPTAGRQQLESARIDSHERSSSPLRNKVSMREHRRIDPNASESDWIDDRSRYESTAGRQQRQSARMDSHAAIDAARQYSSRSVQQSHPSIDAGDEFINDLQNSLIAVGGHQPVRAPVQADDERAKANGTNAASSGEITEREEVLERLRRDLDRLLQSPKVA
jgi:hypothetical protein